MKGSPRRPAAVARALLAGIAVVAASAAAQGTTPQEPGPAVDAGLLAGVKRPLWEAGLGGAVLTLPDYRGSDRSQAYLLPLPYFVYRGTWLKADRDGARATLYDSARAKVDVSLGATRPTRSRDNAARQGMADLRGTVELGPNLDVALAQSIEQRWKLQLRLPARAAFTIERSPRYVGTTFAPHLNLDRVGAGGGWNVGLLTGPLWADRRYHGYFYDVSAADATPARPMYSARAGYGGWQWLASTSRRIGPAWIGAFLRYDRLEGAAFADSPLMRRKDALTAGVGISWVFATSATQVTAGD